MSSYFFIIFAHNHSLEPYYRMKTEWLLWLIYDNRNESPFRGLNASNKTLYLNTTLVDVTLSSFWALLLSLIVVTTLPVNRPSSSNTKNSFIITYYFRIEIWEHSPLIYLTHTIIIPAFAKDVNFFFKSILKTISIWYRPKLSKNINFIIF